MTRNVTRPAVPTRRHVATETPAKAPTPGDAVRGSSSGKPIMALLDLLGRRWSLRIIWELRETQLTFRALQDNCENVSSSVLNQRLLELRDAGIVEHNAGGYALTQEGKRLLDAYPPIDAWAERWAKRSQS